jgi:hypothetical protein
MKKSKDRLPPFVAIPWDILNSKSYKNLKFASAKALPYFLGKPKLRFTDIDYCVSVFNFSYGEALKLGFARETFSRAVKDLQANGFIVKVKSGGLRGDQKSYSKYTLSSKWKQIENKEKIQMAISRIESKNGNEKQLKKASTSSYLGMMA